MFSHRLAKVASLLPRSQCQNIHLKPTASPTLQYPRIRIATKTAAAKNLSAKTVLRIPNLTRHKPYSCQVTVAEKLGMIDNNSPRILITGGLGALGPAVARKLRELFGKENVILSDIIKPSKNIDNVEPYIFADVLDSRVLQSIIVDNRINWLLHFSAIMGAQAERHTRAAIRVNIEGVHNVLELAKRYKLRLFIPSTLGAFGPNERRSNEPAANIALQRPRTLYGISKVHAEIMGEYYHHKFGLDFRSLRLPCIIGNEHDSNDIFYQAINTGKFICNLKPNTKLPLMYVEDCVDAIQAFIKLPAEKLKQRVYNISSMSFSPKELEEKLKNYVPNFEVIYMPDEHQDVAEAWPEVIDDSDARRDWNWHHQYDLDGLVALKVKEANLLKAQKRSL